MPGRNAKPIEQHLLEGNPNRLTKKQIEDRKKAKIALGRDQFTVPIFVKEDPVAYKKWKVLVKEYKAANELGVFLLSSTDIGVLGRYCKTYSEYRRLLVHRKQIDNIEFDYGEALDLLEEETSEQQAKAIFKKIDYILSVDGLTRLDTAINKKQDMLIKMEDRLFLNPLSKIKNIVKTVPKEKEKILLAQNSDPYNPYPDDYPLLDNLVTYCYDIIHGRINACEKHIWACQRFLRDLERENTDEFLYIFDQEKAINFLNWMKLFKHRKGPLRGKRIDPHIIQQFVFGNIYGWIHRDTGYRRFDKGYWQVARKNAKSQSLGTVGSYELAPFGEGASEVYCGATKKDQAKIVWNETDSMIRNCDEVKDKFETAYGEIRHIKSESFMKALSKEDGKLGDGFNPQCGIIDEYHAHKTSEIYDIIESGMVSREQPLLMIITTAGYELNNPCYRVEYDLCSKILNPNVPIDLENYFVMINELDKGDDIKKEANWIKSNPIVASYPVGISSLRKKLKAALTQPEKMRTFMTKNMNVWIEHRENGYMDMAKWSKCGVESLPEGIELTNCYVGIDLSSKIDLTSVSFVFPLPDEYYLVLSHSFMPEGKYQEKLKTDIVPYDLWEDQGWLTVTPGDVVDYNFVEDYMISEADLNGWSIQEVCFDPYNATQFANNLEDQGYTTVEIRQGHRTLGEPTKGFRDAVYSQKIIHMNDPVLGWAMSNAVTKADVNDNIMLDKKMARQRIDPAAATINGFTRAMLDIKVKLPEVTDTYLDELGW